MELRHYIAILWKWAWLIVVGTVLAGGAAFVVSKNMIPIYRASTTLLVSEAKEPTITDYTSIITSERLANTYSRLLTSGSVLEAVAQKLGVETSAEQVSVQPVRDTQLIMLSVEHTDPLLAIRIANEIPQAFIAQNEAMQTVRFAASKESLLEEMANIEGDIERTEEAIADLRGAGGANEEELARLENNLAQYRQSYSFLLDSYEQIRVTEATRLDNIIMVEPAKGPAELVSPRTRQNTLLAAVVGAMLAVGVVFVVEYLDDTLKTYEDVERELALPTLGTIARIEPVEEPGDHVVSLNHPRSPISEAYRVLRSNVRFAWVANPSSKLLVSSAGPEEGKTTTAANLAVVMAQAGKKVILVDSDLRRPALHDFFEVENDVGLTDLLVDRELGLGGALKSTRVDGLQVLTSGGLPPNPAELLGSDLMRKLLDVLQKYAEVIVLDSPPVLAVADATILASMADGAVLVVDAGRTRSDACRRAKEALENSGVKLLGAVLNRLSRKASYGYFYYYYYYPEGRVGKRRRRSHAGRSAFDRFKQVFSRVRRP